MANYGRHTARVVACGIEVVVYIHMRGVLLPFRNNKFSLYVKKTRAAPGRDGGTI
jgi:hypothetical protein